MTGRADIPAVEQLALIDVPATPKLTGRQQRALEHLQAAGWDGLTSDELGARMHDRHSDDDRCAFCGSTGNELGKRLRELGYAQQRRRGETGHTFMVWTIAGELPSPEPACATSGAVPYNEFPPGF